MTTAAASKQWPLWAMILLGIVVIVAVLTVFSVGQDIVDAQATECEDFMARLSDPEITVGEIERLRIDYAHCYPSDWAWPGLLQPRPRDLREK